MKHPTARCSALFILLIFGFSFAAQRNVTVSGVVVDSVTGQPIPNAIVLLLDTNITDVSQVDSIDITKLKPDTAITTANGVFSKTITTTMTNFILAYMVIKEGYSVIINGTIMLSTTIDLDTIKLVPTDIAAKDTITVSGKVVDSATGVGIPGALIGLSGGDLDTVGKTAITDANGNFSRQVIINKVGTLTIVLYVAYKDGYNPAVGSETAINKTVDLGTIILSQNTPVLWKAQQRLRNIATSMTIYSMNGRKLYTGRVAPLNRVIEHSTSAVLVEFRHNGSIIDRKKVMPER
jgi:hypothetical protein